MYFFKSAIIMYKTDQSKYTTRIILGHISNSIRPCTLGTDPGIHITDQGRCTKEKKILKISLKEPGGDQEILSVSSVTTVSVLAFKSHCTLLTV